jgi:Methyltransferase domain
MQTPGLSHGAPERGPARGSDHPSSGNRRGTRELRYSAPQHMASFPAGSESLYYRDSGSLPFASRISLHARRKMFRLFMDVLRPGPDTRILDVGVTSDDAHPESNYFEQMYPYPKNITCVGTEDGSHLARRYPGLTYRQVRPGDSLPFRDGEFDITFSNAVLEHVGSRAAQGGFLREVCRVAAAFFITTPDRWFPLEHHTGLPLLHYLPPRVFRSILRRTPYRHWADESTLNILTAGELRRVFPPSADVEVRSVRLAGLPANLVAFGSVVRGSPASRNV